MILHSDKAHGDMQTVLGLSVRLRAMAHEQ